ncbi:MAG: hypothetical protein H0W42_09155 [Gemmatimonadaceae bacterium]|nr:hypothetical protein [Gemmatimonadaceae bacterium]
MQLSTAAEGRAHQRLLREFLDQHLSDGKKLIAYAMWESNALIPDTRSLIPDL